jgi:segregation and condensation protein A
MSAVDYRIDLDAFGGPMDLLLHLVKKNEIDLYDIPIALVLEQFLDHLKLLTELDVDGVGEFLVMASTLMEIKSRMLLPRMEPVDDDAPEEEDPRSDLVRKLLEYKRFKDVSEELDDMRRDQAKRFPRGSTGDVATTGEEEEEPRLSLEELTLWDLCAAYSRLMREIELAADREVVLDETPIEEHMDRILGSVASAQRVTFRSLFPAKPDRGVVVGIFIALLELVREKKVRVFQDRDFGEIWLGAREAPKGEASEPAESAESVSASRSPSDPGDRGSGDLDPEDRERVGGVAAGETRPSADAEDGGGTTGESDHPDRFIDPGRADA